MPNYMRDIVANAIKILELRRDKCNKACFTKGLSRKSEAYWILEHAKANYKIHKILEWNENRQPRWDDGQCVS